MIKIEETETYGWKAAIRGMRNPKNSWDKSDSEYYNDPVYDKTDPRFIHDNPIFNVGPNDSDLMNRLCAAGSDHRKFMRMIVVYCDITAPLYWWKEFDTYKVGTVANSCSTMHKIHSKEFTIDDFSHEHLMSSGAPTRLNVEKTFEDESCNELSFDHYGALLGVVKSLNFARNMYLLHGEKKYWWQMIQLLPSSYNQKRTVMLNYEVLANIYNSRKKHKLDEWRDFCDWIKTLPYSELITGKE